MVDDTKEREERWLTYRRIDDVEGTGRLGVSGLSGSRAEKAGS